MGKDEKLYSRFLTGEQSAFDEIITLYRERITFFSFSFVKNKETAEDIAMDVFVEILVHPKRYKFKGSFKSYIYSIAHHKAVDFIRRNREIPCEDYNFKDDFKSEDIFKSEDNEILYTAMKHLNDDYKRVLCLVYFEQLESDEIERVMGKNKRQIANLIYRAKQALRQELIKEGFHYEEF